MTRKLSGMNALLAIAATLTASVLGACDGSGITHARIDACYESGFLMPPQPVEIDPRLLSSGAVTVTTSRAGAMDLYQHIVVTKAIRIVPAEGPTIEVPVTQPATQPKPN